MQRIHTEDQSIENEIQLKGKTAPRVTPADIEANIASEHYFTAQEGFWGAHPGFDPSPAPAPALALLTFCVLVLKNGFTVTGESACASPENFDAEIGRKIARQNAVQKIWPLMGYSLKEQLHKHANVNETKTYADGSAATGPAPLPDVSPDGAPALPPHQHRVVAELDELSDRMDKLMAFFNTDIFAGLDADEQLRLRAQLEAMDLYGGALKARVKVFAPAIVGDWPDENAA